MIRYLRLLAMLAATALSAIATAAAPYATAVSDPARPAADTASDANRKPAEMLAFAHVKPGQTIVDYIPGKGYFTRLFSAAVGPTGTVYAVTPQMLIDIMTKKGFPLPPSITGEPLAAMPSTLSAAPRLTLTDVAPPAGAPLRSMASTTTLRLSGSVMLLTVFALLRAKE